MTFSTESPRDRARLSIGRVISRTFQITLRQAPLLLILGVMTIGIASVFFEWMRASGALPDPGDDFWASFRGAPGENLVINLAGLFFLGGAIRLAVASLRGAPIGFGEALGACGRYFPRLFGVGFLSNLAIIAGLILFIVPGLILWARWCVAPAVAVAEDNGVMASMGRSAKLTEGSRARIIGLGFIAIGFMILAAAIVVVVGVLIDSALGSGEMAVNFVAAPFVSILIVAVASVGRTVIYDELVRAREGGSAREMVEVFS